MSGWGKMRRGREGSAHMFHRIFLHGGAGQQRQIGVNATLANQHRQCGRDSDLLLPAISF
jgi:hypothetical protein